MKDLGPVKYALGIRIMQNNTGIQLFQDKLIAQLLSEFKIECPQPPSSPLPSSWKKFRIEKGIPLSNPPFSYRRVIGLLQYLIQCTQPDLAFSTSFLLKFLENPLDIHFNAAMHTLKYLACTKNFMLNLVSNMLKHEPNKIIGFSYSEWGGSVEYKSVSGSLIYFHGTLRWRARKQKMVALSSAEAEYNDMTELVQDLKWCKQLIYEAMGINCLEVLYCDNQSTISISPNQIYHHRA
ncbi:hypothetical protein O181_047758 [Austropuccinia psidii MF-1]|uniref:Reverse transcriptase Ty1/copia-type domain-containing protein n=1 Tax=Austropuccinia psidii MF-1 TaxID=1389203 RepID=A0A9Q3HJU6_9BASI|nr:hypothetical protein [Austropuccinia psidii MF-1]